VWDKIKERIGITLSLNLMSLIIILGVSIPIGVIAAYRAHSWFDQATTLFLLFFGYSLSAPGVSLWRLLRRRQRRLARDDEPPEEE
jgi:peptide/nickel transport system permease protein